MYFNWADVLLTIVCIKCTWWKQRFTFLNVFKKKFIITNDNLLTLTATRFTYFSSTSIIEKRFFNVSKINSTLEIPCMETWGQPKPNKKQTTWTLKKITSIKTNVKTTSSVTFYSFYYFFSLGYRLFLRTHKEVKKLHIFWDLCEC